MKTEKNPVISYTFKDKRGQGFGTAMTEARIKILGHRGYKEIEALSLHPHFFEARGWIRVGKPLRSGAQKVIYEGL